MLALSDWDEVGLVETAQQVQTSTHREVRTDKLDVRDRDAMRGVRRVGAPRSSAGSTWSSTTPASPCTATSRRSSYEDFEWVMDVDFWGVVQGTKEFLPHLIASGDGHVVNISSLFGLLGDARPDGVQRREVRASAASPRRCARR